MVDVLLDTTFLLPFLGFQVKEIQDDDIEFLRLASKSKMIRLFCSDISFVEIFGKLGKRSAVNQRAVHEGIRSLLESGNFQWVSPSVEALNNAFEMRLKGHKDNIDNILYSIAFISQMLFLSLDMQLREFLAKNGFNEKVVTTLKDLSSTFKRT